MSKKQVRQIREHLETEGAFVGGACFFVSRNNASKKFKYAIENTEGYIIDQTNSINAVIRYLEIV